MFNALYITNTDEQYQTQLVKLEESSLPEDGEVTVDVEFSSLNYKDGLAITGTSPVVRKFPMVPGIDFVGTVSASASDQFQVGDRVVLNGFGVGETHWGGLAQKAKVKADWLLHLPDGISSQQVMAIGTGGYTAMLCIMALQDHDITPESGPILVTGANGGVGTFAVSLLHRMGFTVWASTGRAAAAERLKALGASEIIDRATLSEKGKPLAKERWAGAVDTVGSYTLANVCAGTMAGGTVAACGLAQGMDFPATVAPFILRGITLAGIDSVYASMEKRQRAYQLIAHYADDDLYDSATTIIGLEQAIPAAAEFMEGKVEGRYVVDVNA